MPIRLRMALVCASGFALSACEVAPETAPKPTEQEVHARDSDVRGAPAGRHRYACEDGTEFLVDFKDRGLAIDIRKHENDAALSLSAPTQSLQYVAEGATATFDGSRMRLAIGDDRFTCDMLKKTGPR